MIDAALGDLDDLLDDLLGLTDDRDSADVLDRLKAAVGLDPRLARFG